MAKEASQEKLDMVDEVLKDQDPAFLEDLAKLNPEDLNNQQILTPDSAQAQQQQVAGLRGKWHALEDKKKKVILGGSFIVFVGIPIIVLSALGLLTPQFSFDELPSLVHLADEIIPLDPHVPSMSILNLENQSEFTLKTREAFVQLKATSDKKFSDKKDFVRCIFEIAMASEEDRVYVSKLEKAVLDTITNTLSGTTIVEFKSVSGKEQIKQKVLTALNKKLEGKVKSIHYSQILFQ